MSKEKIQQAITEQRWETARRLAMDALSKDDSQNSICLLLHEAYRKLGDYTSARECLETMKPENDNEKLEINLILAEDYYLMANHDHYRSSLEAKAGLSGDEYVDKYQLMSRNILDQSKILALTDIQKKALDEMRERCSGSPHVHHHQEVTFNELPVAGSSKLSGRVRYADGRPAAEVKMVLGLEVPKIEQDPASYTVPFMHYNPYFGEQSSRETTTDAEGHYSFFNLPAGCHEFIAVCLDLLVDDIGTHFLAHNIALTEDSEVSLDLTIRQWQSVEALPVENPFEVSRMIDNFSCRRVHEEVMRNPFYYDFPRQLVSFTLPAGLPADPGRLRLLCSEDPGMPVVFQIDGDQLSFFAELPPMTNRVFALYYAEEYRFKSAMASFLVPEVSNQGHTAILSTGRSDFQIAWGEGSTATAPIQSVRGEDNCWRGSGRWILPENVKITHWASRVISQGPISTTVVLNYQFSSGHSYEIRLTAQQGEPALLVHEICPDLAGAAFEFSLAEFSGGRGFLHWTPENGNMHWSNLSAENRELARLQESVAWWIPPEGFGYAMTADGLEQKDYIGVVTLRRGEWVDRLFERISRGPGNENRELDWPFPEMVGSTVSMITAHTDDKKDAFFRFKCFDGERRWGLLVSTFDRNDGQWKEISSVQHKNSSPRLQEFKDWHLDEPDHIERPFVITRRERLIDLRKKGKNPAFALLRERLANWQAIATDYDRLGCRGLDAMLDADPLKLWSLKKEISAVANIRSRMTLLGRDYSDMYSPVGGRPITPWAEAYDLIAGTGVFSPEEERQTRAFLMLMGHMYMQTDLMNWRFNSRNANFEADRVDIVGAVGLAFFGNPDAKIFIDHAVSLMQRSLEVYCTPGSGKWYENPACYYLHASNCRLNLAFHLWEHDIFDSTEIPRLKDFLSWGINLNTPPYPIEYELMRDGCDSESYSKAKKVRRVPPIGDHAHIGPWFSEYFALMGKVYRQRDPEFAETLFWLHQAGGNNGGFSSRHALFFAVMEEADLRPAQAPEMSSRRLEGFGSVCRGNVGQEDEFYLLFKLGPGGYRYHRTEGSILLISEGKPLIFDGGEAGETWRHTTLSFGETHMPLAAGHIERFHSFDKMDFSQGVNPKALQPGEPVFLSDKCDHQLVELAYERFNEPNPANSRSVLWAKNEYIILHDQLRLAADLLTHWHLQAVADEHTGNWREGYRFNGRFGTDLQVLLPDQHFEDEQITQQPILEYYRKPEDSFAMRHLQLSSTSPNHLLAVLRPLSAGDKPVAATLLQSDNRMQGVTVNGEGIDDIHWFDRGGLEFTCDNIFFKGKYGSILRRGDTTHLIIQDGEILETAGICLRSNGPSVSLSLTGDKVLLQAEGKGNLEITGAGSPLSLKLEDDSDRIELSIALNHVPLCL